MKLGWEVKALGEVATVTKRQGGSRPLPYVGLEDVSSGGNGQFLGSMELQSDKSTTFEFEPRHLLYGRLRPYLNKVLLPDFVGHCSSEIFPILPSAQLDRRFLFYWITSQTTVEAINETCTGARMPRANVADIFNFPIPLPPLDEQKRIVAVLDAAFDGLSRARAHTETNLQNARELFESVLRVSAETDAAKFGTVTVAELALEVTDGDHMPPPKSKTGIPFVTISDVRKDTREIDFSNTFMVPERYFNDLKDKRRPRTGDILYTVTGATLGIPILIKDDRPFCFQRHIGLVRPKALVNSEWLYFMMMSPYVFSQADGGATGAAQRTVSLSVLRGFTVPKIPLERQTDLAASFRARWEASFTMAAHYRAKLADLDALRQSLLQKAFAGELT